MNEVDIEPHSWMCVQCTIVFYGLECGTHCLVDAMESTFMCTELIQLVCWYVCISLKFGMFTVVV